jgi:hypothetical protein
MAWPHSVAAIRDRMDMPEALKRKVLGENALRFYGLGAPVAAS